VTDTVSKVRFTSMDEATEDEIAFVMGTAVPYLRDRVLGNVLELLEGLRGPTLGYRVDRYNHSLQTATRALREDARPDLVTAALLHDIGEGLSPANHADLAATILQPYLDEEATWVVRHHGVFQGYHYWHKMGGDRDARERYRDSRYFDSAAHFCAAWDQLSFDPDYHVLPLEAFLPIVHEVFAREPSVDGFSVSEAAGD
jgi:predicted HD phosphohydrolase